MATTEIKHYPDLTGEKLMEIFRERFKDKYEVCKPSVMFGVDFFVKKSGISGVAVRLKQKKDRTFVVCNGVIPSFFWRLMIGGIYLLFVGGGIKRDMEFLTTTPQLAKT